jgi:hypothetical protein
MRVREARRIAMVVEVDGVMVLVLLSSIFFATWWRYWWSYSLGSDSEQVYDAKRLNWEVGGFDVYSSLLLNLFIVMEPYATSSHE